MWFTYFCITIFDDHNLLSLKGLNYADVRFYLQSNVCYEIYTPQ